MLFIGFLCGTAFSLMMFTSGIFIYLSRKNNKSVDGTEEDEKEKSIKKQFDEFLSYTGYIPPSRGELNE